METIILGLFTTSLGVFLGKLKLVTKKFSKLLGRGLYWFGLPLQIFAIAHQAKFIESAWLPPLITIVVLFLGLIIASINLFYRKQLGNVFLTTQFKHLLQQVSSIFQGNWQDKQPIGMDNQFKIISKLTKPLYQRCLGLLKRNALQCQIPQHRSGQGSFILASTLGSTGYLGLSIVPIFVNPVYSGWAVLYSITQILFGSFGMGVVLANHYGDSRRRISWLMQLRELFKVPALWAFILGWCSRGVNLGMTIDSELQIAVLVVIGGAFLLTGIQIQQVKQIDCFKLAIVPTLLKMLVIPGLTGLSLTMLGFGGDARLSMVLMSGMPTANTNLILAEEYNLDRRVTASTIALSTILLPAMILVWKLLLE
jgi:malate permease and related proteins